MQKKIWNAIKAAFEMDVCILLEHQNLVNESIVKANKQDSSREKEIYALYRLIQKMKEEKN